MPIKHNLTKYDKLKDHIHRLSQKKESEYNDQDRLLRDAATLIAVFASSHSWNTYRELCNGNKFNNEQVLQEFLNAKNIRWKDITPFDISEVVCGNIPQTSFMNWMYYNVEVNAHPRYKVAWSHLKERLDQLENESTTSVR